MSSPTDIEKARPAGYTVWLWNDRQRQQIDRIITERRRQDLKWGADFTDRDPLLWLAILTEEVGEAAEAILDWRWTPDQSAEALRSEVTQVAAVALSWLEHFDTQTCRPIEQETRQ